MKLRTMLWDASLSMALALGGMLLGGSGSLARAQEPAASVAQAEEQASSTLVGTWRVTVTLQNCATGAPLGNPFHSLLSFAAGGTMGGATSNAAFQPGQRSSDFGVWNRTGKTTYSGISEALVVFSGGFFVAGSQTLTHQITLTNGGNGFTAAPGCAAAVGQRLQ
jgi:hypothetical protein